MANTANLALPNLEAGQAQKHVTVNEALRLLDGLVQIVAQSRTTTAPPGSPVEGACYIVAASATGAWSGWDGDVAMWADGSWWRLPAKTGWLAWVVDEACVAVRSGSLWLAIASAAARWLPSGMILGASAQVSGANMGLAVLGTTGAKATAGVGKASNDTTGGFWRFIKSRGAAVDPFGLTTVVTGDTLGTILWAGTDGSAVVTSASILAAVEGTVASGDVRAAISVRPGTGAGTVSETFRFGTDKTALATADGGLGYGTGAGGAVTQLTSKATGVTLNKPCGVITTHNAALAAGAAVYFTLTNSKIVATDVVEVAVQQTTAKYRATCIGVSAGAALIELINISAGSLSEAVPINFAVGKAVNA